MITTSGWSRPVASAQRNAVHHRHLDVAEQEIEAAIGFG
jgi:hypothetical protein